MIRAILAITIFYFCAFASLSHNFYNQKDIEILKSMDIELSFLTTKEFVEIKERSIKSVSKKELLMSFEHGRDFIPLLKELMAKEGIPLSFLYLAMAESEFKSEANSPKKAVGIWQFMEKTARLNGLKIDKYVDERRDPIKSTLAAIRHLKDLKEQFGKWYLAAIAYNAGSGATERAIAKYKTDNVLDLLDPAKKIVPKESREYLKNILAYAMAFESISNLLENDRGYLLNIGASTTIRQVSVPGGSSLKKLANQIDISYDELKRYNRHIKGDIVPFGIKEYEIYIPYKKLAAFKENYDPKKIEATQMVHIVKSGETIQNIAKKYGITPQELIEINNLKTISLKPNQRLLLPLS